MYAAPEKIVFDYINQITPHVRYLVFNRHTQIQTVLFQDIF